LWSGAAGRSVRAWAARTDIINAVAFTRDGKLLGSCGVDGIVRLWNPRSGAGLRTFDEGANVLAMDFASDGKSVACGDSYGLVKVWDVRSARLRETVVRQRFPIVAVAWARRGQTVAWCSLDGVLKRSSVLASGQPPTGVAA